MPGPARQGFAARLRSGLPRRRVLAGAAALAVLATVVTWAVQPDGQAVRAESRMLTVASGPARDQPVRLDTTLYLPAGATAATCCWSRRS